MADEIEAGHLRALLVAGGNPLTALPAPERTRRAFEKLDALAVLDVVENEMTAIATHVLPVGHQLERADVTLRERASYTPAVMPMGADRRPAWWVHAQLGKRLELDVLDGLDPDSADDDAVLRLLIENFNGASNVIKVDTSRATVRKASTDEVLARLVSAGPHGLRAEPRFGWVHERALPDGRWRLAPPVMIGRLPGLLDDHEGAGMRLVSRRHARRVNSAAYAVPELAERELPVAVLHPADAARLEITEGMRVTVSTDAGKVQATAHLDGNIRTGAVSLTHGWVGKNVNDLIGRYDVDPLTGQPRMSAIAVNVAPAPEPDDGSG
jgi:anaerobic selenocysteine-containing dehydrogenase